jgi:hypothetical protein
VRAPLLVAVVLALAACGSEARDTQTGLDSAERTWVRGLAAWMQETERAGARAERLRFTGPRVRFDRVARPVRTCAERYRDRPGRAPTPRLKDIERRALSACREFARAARAESRAFAGDPGEALATADAALAAGNGIRLEMDRRLELLLVWNRPLPVLGGDRTTSRIEPRLGRIAARFARRPAQVRCWSNRDWPHVYDEWQAFANDADIPVAFVASFDRGRVNLDPTICAGLVRLLYRRDVPDGGEGLLDVAEAVAVLAHEVEHLVSPASEAVTECRAVQAIREFARALGASPDQAALLADVYWEDLYPENDAEYRTPLCRDGGPLDLDPETAVWP